MSCTSKIIKTLMASKALFVRVIYALHASFGVVIAATFTKNNYLYFFQLFLLVSIAEYIWTIRKSKKGEWKWFLPSVVIYIVWLVPQVFILEYSAKATREKIMSEMNQDTKICRTNLAGLTSLFETVNLSAINTDIEFSDDEEYHDMVRQLTVLIQQSMMLVFIAGRWLGPKGSLTREQLSQLLLAYVGMAADMLEFITETLKVPKVACDDLLFLIVMGLWSWSLVQFTLGLTATKQRKTRVVGTANAQQDSCSVVHGVRSFLLCCCGGEIWALLVSVIMQDGPYLALRLYMLIQFHEFGQIFFTAKNGILLCLQLYRIAVVVGVVARGKSKDNKENHANGELDDDPPYELSPISNDGNGKTISSINLSIEDGNNPGGDHI